MSTAATLCMAPPKARPGDGLREVRPQGTDLHRVSADQYLFEVAAPAVPAAAVHERPHGLLDGVCLADADAAFRIGEADNHRLLGRVEVAGVGVGVGAQHEGLHASIGQDCAEPIWLLKVMAASPGKAD